MLRHIPPRCGNLRQLARAQIAFFLPFRRHVRGDTISAKSSSECDLQAPGAEDRLPFSCLFGATDDTRTDPPECGRDVGRLVQHPAAA
jgi:hypothetical protein